MKSLTLAICVVLGIALASGASLQGSPGRRHVSSPKSTPEWYQKLSLNEMTMMEIVQTVARERPDAVAGVIQYVTDQLNKYSPAVARDYRTKLSNALLAEPTDGAACNACKIVVDLLKLWASLAGGYPPIEGQIVDACKMLLTALDQNTNTVPLCEGVIPLQAPHVYAVISRTTDVEFCETLNTCYVAAPIVEGWPARPSAKGSKPQPQKKEVPRTKRHRRQAATIKIAQITDVHFEGNYMVGSGSTCGLPVCCKQNNIPVNETLSADRWGEYTCNVPRETMKLFLDKVQELNPDYVIFSGDVPPHTVWDETFQSQFAATSALANEMASTFVNKRVLPCLGNHEMYPTNLFSTLNWPDTQSMLMGFADLWKTLARFTDEEIATMQAAGYYTTELRTGLRALAIMTNYMYSANWYNGVNHKTVDAGLNDGEAIHIKAEIESILQAASDAGEKVILIGHHVVGNSDYIVREAVWFEQLMVRYSDTIVLQVAGHTHTDEFRLFFDDTNTVKSMVYVNPSVDIHGVRNPSVRIYELDETTFQLLDYTQYSFNLAEATDTETPKIDALFSAKEEYNLPNMTAQAWFELLNRFMDDEELVVKHINNEHARAYTAENPERTSCDENCRLRHVCRLRYASYDRTQACNEQWTVTTPAPTQTTASRPTLPTLTTPVVRANRKP